MVGFFDIIQAYFTKLTGRFIMFGGRDMALLMNWRDQGATAAAICRGIRDAVMHMREERPPRSLYNCREYIEPHVLRTRSRTTERTERIRQARVAAQMGSQHVLQRAISIVERAGERCADERTRAIWRRAWYYLRDLDEDLDLDEQYRVLLELEESIAQDFFEAMPEERRGALQRNLESEAQAMGLRKSDEAYTHHINARRRFLLARDHGLVSLLD